jgi:hypothetical protein
MVRDRAELVSFLVWPYLRLCHTIGHASEESTFSIDFTYVG